MATPIALFFLLTVASMLSNFSDSMVNANSEGDALIAFKQSLTLYKNQLQGSIPTELGNLKSLVALELQDNNLTGTIPPSLGNLKSLVFLRLSNNRGLSGDIPQEVSNLPNLKVLDVSNTNLVESSIPRTIPLKNMATPSLGLCKLFFLLPIILAALF
ncbi:hypothetical protein RHGRI_037917 [Rhododendron griersonianum]|uniref:Uncharacterized protein n=1 Tax=Rhododendron griersonianum TaxID=479676 RepID=A0AAV6HXG2_9ERIC|nr:hypothetical protein RHGRI_037917 [Rhododendron griersonianum]